MNKYNKVRLKWGIMLAEAKCTAPYKEYSVMQLSATATQPIDQQYSTVTMMRRIMEASHYHVLFPNFL